MQEAGPARQDAQQLAEFIPAGGAQGYQGLLSEHAHVRHGRSHSLIQRPGKACTAGARPCEGAGSGQRRCAPLAQDEGAQAALQRDHRRAGSRKLRRSRGRRARAPARTALLQGLLLGGKAAWRLDLDRYAQACVVSSTGQIDDKSVGAVQETSTRAYTSGRIPCPSSETEAGGVVGCPRLGWLSARPGGRAVHR